MTGTRNKARGTAWETAIVRYLRSVGLLQVERRALCGAQDRGDIAGLPGWVIEAKVRQTLDLSGALDEAKREAVNAGVELYAAILKRKNHGVAEGYVVMPVSVFAQVVGHGH